MTQSDNCPEERSPTPTGHHANTARSFLRDTPVVLVTLVSVLSLAIPDGGAIRHFPQVKP